MSSVTKAETNRSNNFESGCCCAAAAAACIKHDVMTNALALLMFPDFKSVNASTMIGSHAVQGTNAPKTRQLDAKIVTIDVSSSDREDISAASIC